MVMKQKLAIFDLDGTFFRWQLYHEAVFALREEGLFDHNEIRKLDNALLDWQSHTLSWHEYEQAVITVFEPKIAQLTPKRFEEIAQTIVDTSGHKTYRYTRTLHQKLKNNGYYTLAISGSQQEMAEVFARKYGFDHTIGALYERRGEDYTGMVSRRIPGRKHEIIKEFLASHPDVTLDDSVAIGDSSGDISMLEMVAHPIAFNPDEALLACAQEQDWEIVIERKNIAYTLKASDDGPYILAETISL